MLNPGNYLRALFISFVILFACNSVQAADLKLHKITDNVYAIIGPLTNRTPENLGNNANFGVIVTSQGVVVIDTGGTYKGAERIHKLIKTVTDKPVRFVINTGGQDHRWLGNGYFKALGAKIIANQRAVEDQKERTRDQLFMLGNLVGVPGLEKTEPVYADTTFDDVYKFSPGGVDIEIHYAGQAHTPGDSFVWLPQSKIMFTGDIVYVDRMLGIMSHSNSKSWVQVFEKLASYKPAQIVPGHGSVTNLQKATRDTYDYLVHLRTQVRAFMDAGIGIDKISNLDQSKFEYLENYETLKGRNAQQVYQEMEWE